MDGYDQAYAALPKIADHVINFIRILNRNTGISASAITVIGHSMGAQMGGLIGKRSRLKRIDGTC